MIWIRYRHIKGHYADSPAKVQLLNVVSFLFGFLSVLGLLIVSSFQVSACEYNNTIANAHMTLMCDNVLQYMYDAVMHGVVIITIVHVTLYVNWYVVSAPIMDRFNKLPVLNTIFSINV